MGGPEARGPHEPLIYLVEIDLPRCRAKGAARRAAALGDIVGAAPTDELVGVPVRAVIAGRVGVAQPQRRPFEVRLGLRAAGRAAAPPFELAGAG